MRGSLSPLINIYSMTDVQNIFIQAGATFQQSIALQDANGNPLNVSGMTANAAMKKDILSNNAVILFETSLTTGTCTLRMEANVTANLYPGKYNYDVVITSGTTVFRIAEGYCDVDPGVTGITLFANGA